MAPSMSVAEYYANKTVLITGATGFMGKVLVEKLLRCCPDLKKIFLLMRQKKGRNSKERLDELTNVRVFERLKSENQTSLNKLHLISGNILDLDLGISQENKKLIQNEVQIIFHCAACVRFDMPIRDALQYNTVATAMMLELAEGIRELEVFVHVSTSYCRCEVDVLQEKVYPSMQRPVDVINSVRWMSDELLADLEPKLIKPEPNTYSYTKSLTEELVSQYEGKFPIVIARPSIVTASYKEPMEGWIDNLNGPTGLMVAGGKGVLRSMLCYPDHKIDFIPVDMAINGFILLAYLTAIHKSKIINVCNVTQSGKNAVTWDQTIEWGREINKQYPFSVMLWYPDGSLTSSRVLHEIRAFFVHTLPAYFIDFMLYLLGQKTFMRHVQKRITYGVNILAYYSLREWYFANENFLALRKQISKGDNEIFFTDMEELDQKAYFVSYVKGMREYCLKEDPSTLPQARKLLQRLYWADLVLKVLLGCVILYFGCILFSIFCDIHHLT